MCPGTMDGCATVEPGGPRRPVPSRSVGTGKGGRQSGHGVATSMSILFALLGAFSQALTSEAVAEIRAAGGAQGPAANRQSMTRTSWSPRDLSTDSQRSGARRVTGRAGETNATASEMHEDG